LQLHPDKTRLVDFRYRGPANVQGGDATLATTFNFLGFSVLQQRRRRFAMS